MKNTKRILTLALAIVMILTTALFASCQKEKTTYELISEAMAKTNALDSMEADMVMNMNMSIPSLDTTVEMPITMQIKADGLQSEAPIVSAAMTMSLMGFEISVDIYSEGEYFYLSTMGENYKMKAEDAEDYNAMSDLTGTVKELPEELLAEVVPTESEDGSKTIGVSIPDDQLEVIYGDLIASVKESSAEGGEISACTLSDASVEITVNKDGYILFYGLTFTMDMTVVAEGMSVETTTEMEVEVNYKNPGADVTVTAPEGYQDYPEMDPDELGM